MKMKYQLEKGEKNQLTIRESSALDKKDLTIFTILCEEQYDGKAIKSAISKGKDALISTLRTINLYPQDVYISKIADVVVELYGRGKKNFDEIVIDDYELLTKAAKMKKSAEEKLLEEIDEDIDEESVGIDDLLEDNDDVIKNIKTTIQVTDDDAIDLDKDSSMDDLIK